MAINKNKINAALEEQGSKVQKNETQMENKLKKKLMEAKENEAEIIDSLISDEENEEPAVPEIPAEEVEETPEEEAAEFVDVTGGVEEQDGVFTVKSTADVTLAPGNKIKFVVGDEEFKGTVGEFVGDEEEGILSIELSEEEPIPADEDIIEELPTDEEPETEEEPIEEPEEGEVEELDEDAIIEEVLTENIYDRANYPYNYNYENEEGEGDIIEEVLMEDDPEAPVAAPEAAPVDAPVDAPTEEPIGENPLGTEEQTDVSMDVSAMGAPSAGAPSATPEAGTEEAPAVAPGNDVSQITSTDELIQDILGTEEQDPLDVALANQITEEIIEEVLTEGTKENPEYKKADNIAKDSTKLDTEDLTGKVKETSKDAAKVSGEKLTPSKVAKQTDVNSKKLKTDDVTGSAPSQTKTSKTTPADITSKVKDTKDSAVDMNDDDFKKVKQDNVVKSKALVKLSEDFIKIETENKKLRLENYKLLKLNGLLTLLPELEQKTREQLVEKFDKCSSDAQVIALYKKITNVVKESRKPNLNQLVTGNKKDVKYFTEGRAHDEQLLKEKVDATQNGNQELTPEQLRKNNLMGIKGAEDSYYNF